MSSERMSEIVLPVSDKATVRALTWKYVSAREQSIEGTRFALFVTRIRRDLVYRSAALYLKIYRGLVRAGISYYPLRELRFRQLKGPELPVFDQT